MLKSFFFFCFFFYVIPGIHLDKTNSLIKVDLGLKKLVMIALWLQPSKLILSWKSLFFLILFMGKQMY